MMRSCDNSIKDYISESSSLFDSPLKIKTALYRRFIFGNRKKYITEKFSDKNKMFSTSYTTSGTGTNIPQKLCELLAESKNVDFAKYCF